MIQNWVVKMKIEKNKMAIAAKMFLFNGIDMNALEQDLHFIDFCSAHRYDAGEIIQSATAPLGGLAYIYRGSASVLSDASDKCVLLRNLSCGDVIGASTLYSESRGYTTVIAANKDCAVLCIPEDHVKRIIAANNIAAENYIRFLTERICFLNRKISAFTAGSAEAKLAVYLLSLPQNPDGTITLPCSLSELADMLNMGRASLYRSLDSMSTSGILVREGKKITLLNRDALQNTF